MKKIIFLCLCMAMLCFSLTGCGESNNGNSSENSTTDNSSTNSESKNNDDNMNNGANDTGNGKGNGTGNNTGNNTGNGIGGDIENVIDDAGKAVDDAANGINNTVFKGFESYDDAYDHFMKQLPAGNNKYEVRNNDKDLTEYSSGRQGYHFELHDTTNTDNSKVGDFYLDSKDGKVYHSDDNGKNFSEYNFSDMK